MWKGALFVVLLVVAGHFAVRYVRTNPLDPVLGRGEVVVQTNDFEVRLAREGPVEGTYLVVAAESVDWTNEPANQVLSVIGWKETVDFLRAYPDFHRSDESRDRQLANVASPLLPIAATRLAYGQLHGLPALVAKRAEQSGERVCVTLRGEALRIVGVSSPDDGVDHTRSFENRDGSKRRVLVSEVEIDDCAALARRR